MNNDYSVFRDPNDGGKLILIGKQLYNDKTGAFYPIVNGIPRFVESSNYSDSFGLQWNEFRRTQLDSYSKTNISHSRLERCLNGHLKKIAGKLILEAGSGAGRFTEILLQRGAIVHSFDMSNAVEANYANNGNNERLTLAQGDIRKIPFVNQQYDYVIGLGVLQHTPSPEESISRLYEMVKPGGFLVIDHYLFKLRNILPPPIGSANIIYRKVILSLPAKVRFAVVRNIVNLLFPIHWLFRHSLLAQRILRRISPVHFYFPNLKLKSKNAYYEWALLDTHDSTTDFYKHHRSVNQITNYINSLGVSDLSVVLGGNGIEAFCRKSE